MNHMVKNILRNWADNIEGTWSYADEMVNKKEHSKRIADFLRRRIDSLHDRDDDAEDMRKLKSHLTDLIAQWKETMMLYNSDVQMREAASGYSECIRELEQIMAGDLSPIEKWEK